MRCAVLTPTPFTPFRRLSSPDVITCSSSGGVIDESIILAVFAPTPLTPISSRKSSRSFLVSYSVIVDYGIGGCEFCYFA